MCDQISIILSGIITLGRVANIYSGSVVCHVTCWEFSCIISLEPLQPSGWRITLLGSQVRAVKQNNYSNNNIHNSSLPPCTQGS